MPAHDPDIEAEIEFLTTAAGGRRTPVKTGYRPTHAMARTDVLNDAHHEYPDKEWVHPGETVRTRMWFFAPEYQADRLLKGMEFTVQEGSKIVGHGRILRVLNDAMKVKSA